MGSAPRSFANPLISALALLTAPQEISRKEE